MDDRTQPESFGQLDDRLERLKRILERLTDDLDALQARIYGGEADPFKDTSRLKSDAMAWLKTALEMETKIEERARKRDGIVNHYAIDLAAARDIVGRQLDSLRRACDAETLSNAADE